EIATRRECELPIVVDDQLHAGRSAAGLRLSNLLEQSLPRLLLDAQLHQVHPERREAPHPGGAVDDRIDARQPHPRKAVPTMGDPHGISTRQPAESSRSATTRSSVVYGNTSKPSAHRRRAASASPNGSGCRVSSSPITSSLIHVVANTSRAMCAVVTASFTEW